MTDTSFKVVINHMHKSNFYHTFVLHNNLFLTLCAFCYYTYGCCWLLNWSPVNFYFDSESYWFYMEIKKVSFLEKVTQLKKTSNRLIAFFLKTSQFKECMNKFVALLTKGKRKMAMSEWENDDSDIFQAWYSVYKK